MDTKSVGRLEDEALRRKERLKALKRGDLKSLNENQNSEESSDIADKDEPSFPKALFRNYNPKDEGLKSNVLPRPDLTEIRNEIKDQLESGKPKPLIENEIDLATLAPQKIDWDLKREAEKKLKVLEKRTQKAIVEIIRDRLKSQKNTDLAELVSIGSRNVMNKDHTQNSQGEEESDEDDDDDNENVNGNGSVSAEDESQEMTEDDSKMEKDVYVYEKHDISDEDDY